ncbi:MAG TPA: hypothetical protein VI893_03270 [Thermoplasmata archaeon]|nr:hypothetical protein [Thermoplasmata archaeon]
MTLPDDWSEHPNELVARLNAIIAEYGTATPPIEVRRPLWELAASIRRKEALEELSRYLDQEGWRISGALLGELGRILGDNPDFPVKIG